MNSTLLQTAAGRSILVQYDTTTARPYSRLNHVQGTGGAFAGFPNRIALEDPPHPIRELYEEDYEARLATWTDAGKIGPEPSPASFHRWDTDMDKWYRHFDHPLWKSMQAEAEAAGGHDPEAGGHEEGVSAVIMHHVTDQTWFGFQSKHLAFFVLAALLLAGNWTSYVWAVTNDRVIETALGYFLAPLATMALGVFVLRERLTPLKRASIVFAVAAVVVLTVSYLAGITVTMLGAVIITAFSI